jgi:two-component system LytT family sensor kinase
MRHPEKLTADCTPLGVDGIPIGRGGHVLYCAHMKTRIDIREMAVWALLALIAGLLPVRVGLRATSVQGPALTLMIVSFVLTLPGRAPVWLVAVGTWLGTPLMLLATGYPLRAVMLISFIPAFIAAAGGRLAGSLLDTAASKLADPDVDASRPWYDRPLSTRFILAVLLVAIASLGVAPLAVIFSQARYGASSWLSLVWTILTLLGWIALTPVLLEDRPGGRGHDDARGIRPLELVTHVAIVVSLTAVHAAAMIGISALLSIPIPFGWSETTLIAFKIFLPLDALAYLTILALGFASDVERLRRQARQRETALAAESLEARLAALRARLNPHFLFNALNSVTVLARTGKTEETNRLVEGLTSLLRYVLDERRQTVPLHEELDFARRFLEVQRVRFGDRLHFEVTSDATADAVPVPQLLLQPIVENAIEHGVNKTLDGGTVTVHAVSRDGEVRITVRDDGPGPGGEPNDAATGIGLANTRERLGRLFGDRARLTLARTSASGGTQVEILLPLTS